MKGLSRRTLPSGRISRNAGTWVPRSAVAAACTRAEPSGKPNPMTSAPTAVLARKRRRDRLMGSLSDRSGSS